ncbi:MAG: secretin N-terminal domain-containing protein [Syntrophorhabdaceae bacterium]
MAYMRQAGMIIFGLVCLVWAAAPIHSYAQTTTTVLGKASEITGDKRSPVPVVRSFAQTPAQQPGNVQNSSPTVIPKGETPAQPTPAPGSPPQSPALPPPAGPEVPTKTGPQSQEMQSGQPAQPFLSPETPVQPPTREIQPPTRQIQPPTRQTQPPTRQTQPPTRQTQPPTREVQPPAQARPQARPAPAARPNAGRISLNFDDADIFSVIQTVFGEILKANYVVDQRVKGRVTFRSVAPVSIDQVLPVMETILRINGIGIVEESGLYRIVPIGDVAKEPAQIKFGRDPDKVLLQGKSIIQVIPLVHVHSSETIKMLTPFLTSTAVVVDLPNINHLIIVDTDSNVKRLLTLINFFDGEQTKLKKPQVSVYNIQNSKAKDVASILQQVLLSAKAPERPVATTTATTGGTTQPAPSPAAATRPPVATGGNQSGGDMLVSPITKIIADENLNALIILSTPEDYEFIKTAIARIDVIPRQVLLEGVIAEVTLKDELKLGISWALQFQPGNIGGVLGAVDAVVGFNVPGATPTATTGAGTFTFAGEIGGDFKTVVDMLATDSRAKLLAVPHILVSDNKEARIQVGDQVPVVSSETFGSGTIAPQRTIQYKDIGIILKVKPRINEGGLVTLDLAQEVSSYETIKLFDNEDYIILHKTETTTSLVCQDGNTIIIGGLIRDDIARSRSGIPFLSKIPILGWLFGSTTDTNNRTELILLLTPRVIRNHFDANNVTSDYVDSVTKTGKGKVKREELLKRKAIPVPPAPMSDQGGIPKQELDIQRRELLDQPVPGGVSRTPQKAPGGFNAPPVPDKPQNGTNTPGTRLDIE